MSARLGDSRAVSCDPASSREMRLTRSLRRASIESEASQNGSDFEGSVAHAFQPALGVGGGVGGTGPSRGPETAVSSFREPADEECIQHAPFWPPLLWKVQAAHAADGRHADPDALALRVPLVLQVRNVAGQIVVVGRTDTLGHGCCEGTRRAFCVHGVRPKSPKFSCGRGAARNVWTRRGLIFTVVEVISEACKLI